MIFRIANRGNDATDGDLHKLSVHNDYPALKVKTTEPPHFDTAKLVIGTEPGAGTTNLLTIPHNFSYTPLTIAQYSVDDEEFYLMPFRYDIGFMPARYKEFRCYSDLNNIYIDIFREGAGPSAKGTYFVKYSVYVDYP